MVQGLRVVFWGIGLVLQGAAIGVESFWLWDLEFRAQVSRRRLSFRSVPA